jgi:hypothetical protein
MWAALLANAASSGGAEKVRPGFIAILKQMAPDEAALLNWMFDHCELGFPNRDSPMTLKAAYTDLRFSDSGTDDNTSFLVCLDALQAWLLIEKSSQWKDRSVFGISPHDSPVFRFTALDKSFMSSCRPPALLS